MSDSQPRFRSLELAACGWSPADWPRVFYPDDLPQDWQVAYYANEFDCVLLPADGWADPVTQAAFWQAEVPPDFRFYLEVTPQLLQSAHWPQLQDAVKQYLYPQLKGVLLPAGLSAELPEEWRSRFPLHEQLQNDWLTVTPTEAEAQTGLIRDSQPLEPQTLRRIFERLQTQTQHPDVTLFMDIPWVGLEQFRLMKQLYGV